MQEIIQNQKKEIFQSYEINTVTGENKFLLEIKDNDRPIQRVTGTSETVKGSGPLPRMIITQTIPHYSNEIIDSKDVYGYIKKLIDASAVPPAPLAVSVKEREKEQGVRSLKNKINITNKKTKNKKFIKAVSP